MGTVQEALQRVVGQALTLDLRLCKPDEQLHPPGATAVGTAAATASEPPRAQEPPAPAPEPAEAPPAAVAPPPPIEQPPPPSDDDFQLQPGQTEEPARQMTTDEAVAQTLSLFEGSQEILPPEQTTPDTKGTME